MSSHYYDVARSNTGLALGSSTVTVYDAGTSTKSTIYTDSALSSEAQNPLTASSAGDFDFWTGETYHRIAISKDGYQGWDVDYIPMPITSHADLDDLVRYGATVSNSSAQTLSNGSSTTLSWDTEVRDDGGMWVVSPNPERIDIVVDGWYAVSLNVRWATNGTGVRIIRVKNSTATLIDSSAGAVSGVSLTQSASSVYFLSAGDYVYAEAYQNSGGNLDIQSNQTFFSIARFSDG